YALVLLSRDEPQKLVAARRGPPLVIGQGEGERFVASDIPALLPYTRDFVFLDDGDVAVVTPEATTITDASGQAAERPVQRIAWDPGGGGEGGLPPLHAQGDPRAAARGPRYPARAHRPRRGRGPPRGARGGGSGFAQGRPGRAPRLRHELARRARREIPARAGG